MPDIPTRAELFNAFGEGIANGQADLPPGERIDPEQVFTPGSDTNLLGAGASAMGEEAMRALAAGLLSLTLEAEGEDLDRVVADRFNGEVVRKGAAPARGVVAFSRPAAGPAGTIDVGTQLQGPAGQLFELTTQAAFGGADLGPVTAQIRAVDAGDQANNVSQFGFVTPPFDTSITVALAVPTEPTAGGTLTETDGSLRARARLFYTAARRGTLPAIEFGALTVAGVATATAIEEVNAIGEPTGRVVAYIADARGQSNAVLNQEVVLALREFRCGGIVVDVVGAIPVFIPIQYNLNFASNVDTALAADSVRNIAVARVNALAPQVTLLRSLLIGAAGEVEGVTVPADGLPVPAGDVVPAPGEIIKTRPDLVAFS